MSLLAPLGALALLAVPIITLLYFLKVKRPARQVSTLRLWRSFVADRQANAPWQRLRGTLLLVLQLLAAGAIALAVMRPGISGAAGVSTTTVVLLDGSASMQATDQAPSRFGAAVAEARRRATELRHGQQMAIVLLGAHAQLLSPPSADTAVLNAALDRARPTGGEVDLAEGISLANAVLAGRTDGVIDLISDGHAIAPPNPPRLAGPLEFVRVGSTGENVGIEAISRIRSDTIFVRVANYGRSNRDLRIEFLADGRLVDVLPLHVGAAASTDVTWPNLPASSRVLQARLSPPDAFGVDDSAWLVTAAPALHRVLLVTAENGFLARALGLRSGVQVTVQKPADYKPDVPYDLYVFDGFVPPGRQPQPALYVAPPPGQGPVAVGAVGAPGPILPADQRDAILQDVVLKDVHVQVAARTIVPAGWRVAIAGADLPLLLIHQGEPRVAEMTFDLHQSDLPLRAAFPILIQNLLGYLLPGGFESRVFAPDRPVTLATEVGATAVEVTTPDGRTSKLAPPFPAAPFTDTGRPGIYSVRQELPGGARTSYFAVNFADPALSRIAPGPAPTIQETGRPTGPVPRGTLELWPWVALAALVLLAGEWVVFHRGPR